MQVGARELAVLVKGQLGYQLRRVKFKAVFLFVEWDWAEGAPFGTAIPLTAISEMPPTEENELLVWLQDQEVVHETEIKAAWASVVKDFGV